MATRTQLIAHLRKLRLGSSSLASALSGSAVHRGNTSRSKVLTVHPAVTASSAAATITAPPSMPRA
jgi:hypothetical protein